MPQPSQLYSCILKIQASMKYGGYSGEKCLSAVLCGFHAESKWHLCANM